VQIRVNYKDERNVADFHTVSNEKKNNIENDVLGALKCTMPVRKGPSLQSLYVHISIEGLKTVH
jgi:hypothetical protein